MIQKRSLLVLGAFSAAAVACGDDVGTPTNTAGTSTSGGAGATGGTTGGGSGGIAPATGGSAGSGTGGSGVGGASAGTSGATGGAGSSGAGGVQCVPGTPSSSQIPRLLKRQYDAVLRDLLDVTTLSDGKPPSSGLYDDFDGPMNASAWRLFQEVAAKVAAEVMAGPSKTRFITCDPAAAGCLTDTIKAFGRKAFRRPLTPAEETSFGRFTALTSSGTPAQVAEAILRTFLASPSFLQITELAEESEAGAIKLSQHEVAARLSFLLWGSVPDEFLSTAADNGELTTKEQILAQAERMIEVREKTAPLVSEFHRAYLDMGNADAHWWKVEHDKTQFPLYFDAAKDVFSAELDRFFEEVVFTNGSFKDIFLSNVGFVNRDSAPIYGLDPAAYGTELTRVELDPATRPGFLTRLGFLSSYAHFDGSAPILRGAFITVNIIGLNPGAPDPDFFLQQPPPGNYTTERAFVEALTNQGACRGCHIPLINPPGFVLENYDGIGKWQTVDQRGNGDPVAGAINATAEVTVAEGVVKTISSPRQLMEEIAQGAVARRLYAERWVAFATGRAKNPNDACTVDVLDAKMAVDGYTVLKLLADLTQSDSFRLRVRATP
jgi:hypothetical protein